VPPMRGGHGVAKADQWRRVALVFELQQLADERVREFGHQAHEWRTLQRVQVEAGQRQL
jgi:hypothetical protein